jgi:pilus assembly protein CpaE
VSRTVTTVALGFEKLSLSEEVLHVLERDPAFRVVGTAQDEGALSRLVRDAHPAAVVGSPGVLARAYGDGAVRLAVAEEESVASLREAIRAGVAGFYLWPEERPRLMGDAVRLVRRREQAAGPRGRVVAVYGARGGAGATFLATHLAAAAARLERSTCVVECDPFFADLSGALGVTPEDGVRTIEDLVPVLEELSAEHVQEVLYAHPAGFGALLGPHDPSAADGLRPAHLAAVVGVLAAGHELVLLHPSRSIDDLARAALGMADEILLVLSLDVLAMRDARRTLSFLEGLGLGDRCRLVLNRAARAEIVPADAERVLGLPVAAVLRHDRAVAAAQDRGELVLGRSPRTARALVRLARSLVEVAA